MRELKSKIIKGKDQSGKNADLKYEVGMWGIRKALAWEKFLMERLTKSFSMVVSTISGGLDSEFDGKKMAEAIDILFKDLSEEEYVERHKELLEGVLEDGKPIQLEQFGGRLLHLKRVCFFVLEVQFADFFQELGDRLGSLKQAALSKISTTAK